MVVPNKVYEAMAMAKPIITSDTPSARQVLRERESVLFSRAEDAESLAGCIRELKENDELRQRIAWGGYKVFEEKYSPRCIGIKIFEILKEDN